MKFTRSNNQIILRLEKGEEISQKLSAFFEKENIAAGSFTAIGAVLSAELGFYTLSTKKYHYKTLDTTHEIVSLTGNIALVGNKLFVHMHCVLSNENFQTLGGHLKSAVIGATCEIFITIIDTKIERKQNDEVGLKLLDLENDF